VLIADTVMNRGTPIATDRREGEPIRVDCALPLSFVVPSLRFAVCDAQRFEASAGEPSNLSRNVLSLSRLFRRGKFPRVTPPESDFHDRLLRVRAMVRFGG